MKPGRVTLIRHAYGAPPSPKGKASTWSVFTLFITANTLIQKGFARSEKHKPLAFPAGEGADQRMRREADEGHASTAFSVRQQTVKQQFVTP